MNQNDSKNGSETRDHFESIGTFDAEPELEPEAVGLGKIGLAVGNQAARRQDREPEVHVPRGRHIHVMARKSAILENPVERIPVFVGEACRPFPERTRQSNPHARHGSVCIGQVAEGVQLPCGHKRGRRYRW